MIWKGIRVPCFSLETDPNIVIIQTTEPPSEETEQATEPPTEVMILIGEMKAKIEQLMTDNLEMKSKVESLEMMERWTATAIESVSMDVYNRMNQVEEVVTEMLTEQIEETIEETEAAEIDGLPVLPPPQTEAAETVETQTEPNERKGNFWSMKNWLM